MERIEKCGICSKRDPGLLIDFGPQVVCHHFLKSPSGAENVHRLTLGQCDDCGTVQLIDRIPIDALKPRYGWLKCNEPEDHLDWLVRTLVNLPGITEDSNIGAISFKDDSTLKRLNRLGFKNTWRADPVSELSITDPLAWFESVHTHFNIESLERLVRNHGKVDIFLARHILEHAYNPRQFIEMCKKIIKPQGYIIFEVPDCQRALEKYDYTTIWEEHQTYFTERTFRRCFELNGLALVDFEKIPYPIEDSYVGIARVNETVNPPALKVDSSKEEILRGKNFAGEYDKKKNRIKQFFTKCRERERNVALFGAGHMSCVFLNLFKLQNDIKFVVDDNPHMRGLFMPGSKLPVLESKTIYERDIKVCILTLNASSEEKVIGKNQKFLENGGEFLSVFPGSKWAMEI